MKKFNRSPAGLVIGATIALLSIAAILTLIIGHSRPQDEPELTDATTQPALDDTPANSDQSSQDAGADHTIDQAFASTSPLTTTSDIQLPQDNNSNQIANQQSSALSTPSDNSSHINNNRPDSNHVNNDQSDNDDDHTGPTPTIATTMPTGLDWEIDPDSDEDADHDGLSNREEKLHGTNPRAGDTDADGLNDYDEVATYHTDPNQADTDGDGLTDYNEITLGLNPLLADSKHDGIRDGARELTYRHATDNLVVALAGTGNLASITLTATARQLGNPGDILDTLYHFQSAGSLTQATATLTFSDTEWQDLLTEADELAFYQYHTDTLSYSELPTTVDFNARTLTATVPNPASFIVGSRRRMQTNPDRQIFFAIDHSASMDRSNSDPDGLRFSLTKQLILQLQANRTNFGFAKFAKTYALISELGTTPALITDALDDALKTPNVDRSYTDIATALSRSMKQFSGDGQKYLVILTDGEHNYGTFNTDELVETAKQSQTHICAIGFGDSVQNEKLSYIAEQTDCHFYSSTKVDELAALLNGLRTQLTDNLINTDGDDQNDAIVLAQNNFIPQRDGFSFQNFASTLVFGHCYGMSKLAQQYYQGDLSFQQGSTAIWSRVDSQPINLQYSLNRHFTSHLPLYDFHFTTNALQYMFGKGLQYAWQNGNLVLTNSADILATGLYNITQNRGTNYLYESPLYDEAKAQTSAILQHDDLQLLNAITLRHYDQYKKAFRVFTNTEQLANGLPSFVDAVRQELAADQVPIFAFHNGYGWHAVNATSVAESLDLPNRYYLFIYDNNYPGTTRRVDLDCAGTACSLANNSYYQTTEHEISLD